MKLPYHFYAETAHKADQETWQTKIRNHNLHVGVPKEFGGTTNDLSPEDLFLAAVTNCFIATFKVICEKNEYDYSQIKIDSELVVDKNERKRLSFTKVNLDIYIKNADESRLEKIIKLTKNNCLVHNSIKTEIDVNIYKN